MGILNRINKILAIRNPDNTLDPVSGTDEIHVESDSDDSIQSTYAEEISSRHCGCFNPPGGRCYDCGKVSCSKCHRHCGGSENQVSHGCGRPLCREHANHLTLDDAQTLPFCGDCHGKITRKNNRKKIGRLMLSPFAGWKDDNE